MSNTRSHSHRSQLGRGVGLKVQGSFVPLDLCAIFTSLGFLCLRVHFSLQRLLSGEAGANGSCYSHEPRASVAPDGAPGTETKLRQASRGSSDDKGSNVRGLGAEGSPVHLGLWFHAETLGTQARLLGSFQVFPCPRSVRFLSGKEGGKSPRVCACWSLLL